MKMIDGIPRRNRLDLHTPAETAIRAAVDAVEAAGAHPLLTEAVVLLGQAREKVADFVEREQEAEVTKSGIPLEWGTNQRGGKAHTEWHAPCGCAFHPKPKPHWHPCSIHTPQAGEE